MYGGPQVSILGPLLFLFYLNKGQTGRISAQIVAPFCLYADDVNLFFSGKTPEGIELFFKYFGLSRVKEFLDSKDLLLNTNKSKFIYFSTKQTRAKLNFNIFMNTDSLVAVDSTVHHF